MKALRNLYNIICIPALLVHEFSHALLTYLTFGQVADIYFMLKKRSTQKFLYISGAVVYKKPCTNFFKQVLVHLSPLFVVMLFVYLSFSSTICLGILIYFLLSFPYSFPSKGDIKRIRKYRECKRHNFDTEEVERIFAS